MNLVKEKLRQTVYDGVNFYDFIKHFDVFKIL